MEVTGAYTSIFALILNFKIQEIFFQNLQQQLQSPAWHSYFQSGPQVRACPPLFSTLLFSCLSSLSTCISASSQLDRAV